MALVNYQKKTEVRTSKLGYDFDVYDSKWRLDNSTVINWHLLPNDCESIFIIGFKEQLADWACELSASSSRIVFSTMLSLLRKTGAVSLTLSAVQNYLSTLDSSNEYKLGSIRAFLLNWIDKKIEGIDPQLGSWLEQLTLKGMNKGVPVAKGCPFTGAYSMQEQHAVLNWSVNAFMDNKLSLRDYSWLLLNIYLGARPAQFCQFRARDLKIENSGAEKKFMLDIPQAKKHGQTNFRDDFVTVEIDEELALLFTNQANATLRLIEKQVGELPVELKEDMPLFAAPRKVDLLVSVDDLRNILAKTPDRLHMSRNVALKILHSLSAKCDAKSERLEGEYIHLTARRFRYTLGTNAARRGLSLSIIAKVLHHSDTQNASVYTENVKELTEEVNEALAPVLAPLAQAFSGQLIDSEADAIRVNDPRSRIHNRNGNAVGNCGSFGFCATGGRACYTCAKFQPWVHGRHQLILDDLLEERERLKSKGASAYVLQSTDRTVLAITQVIQLCEKAKMDEGVVNG